MGQIVTGSTLTRAVKATCVANSDATKVPSREVTGNESWRLAQRIEDSLTRAEALPHFTGAKDNTFTL